MDFVIDRLFMKLFKTNKIYVVRECQQYFNFELPSVSITNRAAKNFKALFHIRSSAINAILIVAVFFFSLSLSLFIVKLLFFLVINLFIMFNLYELLLPTAGE